MFQASTNLETSMRAMTFNTRDVKSTVRKKTLAPAIDVKLNDPTNKCTFDLRYHKSAFLKLENEVES